MEYSSSIIIHRETLGGIDRLSVDNAIISREDVSEAKGHRSDRSPRFSASPESGIF